MTTTTDILGGQVDSNTHCRPAAEDTIVAGGHALSDAHERIAASDHNLPPTIQHAQTIVQSSAGSDQPGQEVHDTQRDYAGPHTHLGGHGSPGTHNHDAAEVTTSPPASFHATPQEQPLAASNLVHPPVMAVPTPSNDAPAGGPVLADPVLALFADVVEDLESVRIANANRLRQLTDDSERGHGLSTAHPEVERLRQLVDQLSDAEHQAVLSLKRAIRAHPLGSWVKDTRGIGEKQAARLLAVIRDPYWNDLHQRPRTVSELWAYCGFHTVEASHPGGHARDGDHSPTAARVAPTRRRGQHSNWNSTARQRVWLIAESCVKVTSSPYRAVYDQTRAKYSEAVHAAPCVRCGPSGSPAQPGSPLSAGHQHARALRAIAKAILRDLWRESAAIHASRSVTN